MKLTHSQSLKIKNIRFYKKIKKETLVNVLLYIYIYIKGFVMNITKLTQYPFTIVQNKKYPILQKNKKRDISKIFYYIRKKKKGS